MFRKSAQLIILRCPSLKIVNKAQPRSVEARFFTSDSTAPGDEYNWDPKQEFGDEAGAEREFDSHREALLRASLDFVPRDGWTKDAIRAGARSLGFPATAHAMLENNNEGLTSEGMLVMYFCRQTNSKFHSFMAELAPSLSHPEDKQRISTTQFFEASIQFCLSSLHPHLSTWPQALAVLCRPSNILQGHRLFLELVDDMWYYAGDKSTDINWYSKRLLLAGVMRSTELYMLQDTSPDFEDTWKFLSERLKDVGVFGKQMSSVKSTVTDVCTNAVAAITTIQNIVGLNSTNR